MRHTDGSEVSIRPEFSLIVAFGTDMGNAEDAAMTFVEAVGETGIDVQAIELNQLDLAQLRSTTHFIVVTSTFGDGEFPDNAIVFWEAISAETERLEHLSFAVLALGDSSYELFCNAGLLLDERLAALGATRLVERVDVDGPYEQPAAAWTADVVKLLSAERTGPTKPIAAPIREHHHQPVAARLAVNRRLTTADSDKEVRHYEIDLPDCEFGYVAGDSIAVHPTNDPLLVDAILSALGVGADHRIADHDEPLGVLLAEHLEIRTPSRALQEMAGVAAFGEDVLDLVTRAPLTVDEVVDALRPLQFRDYSIASSPLLHPDCVHLTVTTVRYTAHERMRGGVASTFLAERGAELRIHLRPNHDFRLPAPDVPIIMIGPGTGIAPFRAFLQERRVTGAAGRSWLFFGDRRRATDFLYGDELQELLHSRTLTRLDLAFSRDGGPKQYVQQRMRENAVELFDWLEDGAHVYVCGDEKRMAKDVDVALRDIVACSGRMDAAAAHSYVNELIKTHRYVRDVY